MKQFFLQKKLFMNTSTCKVYFDLHLLEYFRLPIPEWALLIKTFDYKKTGSLGSILFYASFKWF